MRLMVLLVMMSAFFWAAGCATENDSNMPWSTPQSWEGAPSIPGFSPSGR